MAARFKKSIYFYCRCLFTWRHGVHEIVILNVAPGSVSCEYTYIYSSIHVQTHIYVHIYIHTCIRTYTYTYIHTYTHTYIHIHVHTCSIRVACMHVWYIHACIHSHTHTHIHAHMHTHTNLTTKIHALPSLLPLPLS
jgi:hypothetical protein